MTPIILKPVSYNSTITNHVNFSSTLTVPFPSAPVTLPSCVLFHSSPAAVSPAPMHSVPLTI